MSYGKSTAAAALLVSLLVPAVASAQYGDTGDSERPTIHVLGHVGAMQIIRDLNIEKTDKLAGGVAFGAGVGMQVNPNLAFRVNVDYSPSEGDGFSTSPFTGESLNRTFYGVDMQVRATNEKGIFPFFALGLGGVSVGTPTDDSFATFAGKGGFGIDYMPSTGPLSFFGAGNAYLYKFDAYSYERWQVDMLWSVGVKYRLTN